MKERFQDIDLCMKETYEYAFSAVPVESRKATGKLVLILAGFAFSNSGMAAGIIIGRAMTFYEAVAACLLGNLLLFFVALFWGMSGCDSGYTSVSLMKRILGDKVAVLFSGLVILSMIIWIGVNGNMLARLILTMFPRWPLPIAVTTLLVLTGGILSSIKGWKWLEIVAGLCVPLIILLTIYNIARVGEIKGGFDFLLHYQPKTHMPMMTVLSMMIGNFMMPATTVADICRFAKCRRSVLTTLSVYAVILFVCNICGVLIAQATEANNLNYGIYLLGMIVPSFLWLVLCVFTTQNVTLYTASLAVQGLVRRTVMGGNISYKTAVLFIGGLSVIAGIIGTIPYVRTSVSIIVIIILSLSGLVLAELLLRKLGKAGERRPLVAWGLGAAICGLVWFGSGMEVWSFPTLVSGGLYVAIRKKENT